MKYISAFCFYPLLFETDLLHFEIDLSLTIELEMAMSTMPSSTLCLVRVRVCYASLQLHISSESCEIGCTEQWERDKLYRNTKSEDVRFGSMKECVWISISLLLLSYCLCIATPKMTFMYSIVIKEIYNTISVYSFTPFSHKAAVSMGTGGD